MQRSSSPVFFPLWNRLQQFQTEMNRLMNQWDEGSPAGYPLVNVWEDGEQVLVEAEVPGLCLEDLELYVTGGNQVTLKGTRKAPSADKSVWHRQERVRGSFARTLTLPFPVDSDKVDAKLEDGILTLRLTKHTSALPRKITVKGA